MPSPSVHAPVLTGFFAAAALAAMAAACEPTVLPSSNASTGTAPSVELCCNGGIRETSDDFWVYLDGGVDADASDTSECPLSDDFCRDVCGLWTPCQTTDAGPGVIVCLGCIFY